MVFHKVIDSWYIVPSRLAHSLALQIAASFANSKEQYCSEPMERKKYENLHVIFATTDSIT